MEPGCVSTGGRWAYRPSQATTRGWPRAGLCTRAAVIAPPAAALTVHLDRFTSTNSNKEHTVPSTKITDEQAKDLREFVADRDRLSADFRAALPDLAKILAGNAA